MSRRVFPAPPLGSRRAVLALGALGAAAALPRVARGTNPHGEPAPRGKEPPASGAQVRSPAPIESPEMALAELEVGNKRFVAGRRTRSVDTGKDPELRAKLAKGQSPFAVVVTCSDSRVPDNIVFDQEPGRLFTVREAGNSPDLQGIASIDYAVEHLGAKVVVIMGHTSCGAVQAVYAARGKPLPGNLWAFQAAMAGLVESAPQNPKEEQRFYLERLVETNARRQAQNLVDRSDMVRTLAKLGKLWVVPAVYSLKTGEARLLDRVQVGGDATASAGGHH